MVFPPFIKGGNRKPGRTGLLLEAKKEYRIKALGLADSSALEGDEDRLQSHTPGHLNNGHEWNGI